MPSLRCHPFARHFDTLHTVMPDDKLRFQILDGARPGETVIVLQGVLNAETAFQFRDSLRQNESATLVVDMSRVRYVDSSGLGVLIGAYVTFERNCRRLLLEGLNDSDLGDVSHVQDRGCLHAVSNGRRRGAGHGDIGLATFLAPVAVPIVYIWPPK
jgi:anti-anti-sigma factor